MSSAIHVQRVTLRGTVQETSSHELLDLIPVQALERIKAKDPHPMFVELSVGHEGVSTGKVLWDKMRTSIRKIWNRAVVQELAEKLMPGTPVFDGHAKGDDIGRRDVGRVLTRYVREVGGRLYTRAIAYIHDPVVRESIRRGDRDINSIEAVLQFQPDTVGDWIVKGVEQVTGIALASTKKGDVPGFAGATIVSAIQCLAEQGEGEDNRELIDKLEKAGIEPLEVYSLERLTELSEIKRWAYGERKRKEDLLRERGSEIENLKQDLAEKQQTLTEQESRVESLQAELKKNEAAARLRTIAQKRLEDTNLDDPLKQAIIERIANQDYSADDDESLEKLISQKVEQELDFTEQVHNCMQPNMSMPAPLSPGPQGPMDYLNPDSNQAIPKLQQ